MLKKNTGDKDVPTPVSIFYVKFIIMFMFANIENFMLSVKDVKSF